MSEQKYEPVLMAGGAYWLRVGPDDVVSAFVAQPYSGPFAGDASGKIHISVNGAEVLVVAGTRKDIDVSGGDR